ncbi:MAG: LuxR C-terminal-related transcriptional regulator [Vulcanimicrobiaceae bacterium]
MLDRPARDAPALSAIAIGIVAERETTRAALLEIVGSEPDFTIVGSASNAEEGERLLDEQRLRVLLVNLPLRAAGGEAPGLAFIRHAKARRPQLGILSLKREIDEDRLRAALDAGADACCMATTSSSRLVQAIRAVAEGATWLDPEISRILLHPERHAAQAQATSPHLSPRELQILRLVTDGCTNEEIADRLSCAPATVKTHLVHLFRKMGVRDRVSAAVSALRIGLL